MICHERNWCLYTRRRNKWQTKTISRYLETDKLLKRLMNVNNARCFTLAFSTLIFVAGTAKNLRIPPFSPFKHRFPSYLVSSSRILSSACNRTLSIQLYNFNRTANNLSMFYTTLLLNLKH